VSDALDCLDRVLNTGRAPTQRRVYKSLLAGKAAPFEVAVDTGLDENPVNIALCKLVKAGVVDRPVRARYYVNTALLALHLSDRVKELEEKIVKKRGAQVRTSQTPRSTSRSAPQPAPEGGPT